MSILVLCLLTFIESYVETYFFRFSPISGYVTAKPNLLTLREKPNKSSGGIIFHFFSEFC